jgi:arsenate reductase (glutaredoxin)
MALIVYGIPNCDTVKKARRWLDERGADYRFHDFRKDGLTSEIVDKWMTKVPWDRLVNKRGTTWRKLSAEEQQISDESGAKSVMLAHPSVIKRPVFDLGGKKIVVGFSKAEIDALSEVIDGSH